MWWWWWCLWDVAAQAGCYWIFNDLGIDSVVWEMIPGFGV